MTPLRVNIQLLRSNSKIPTHAYKGDAGYDVYFCPEPGDFQTESLSGLSVEGAAEEPITGFRVLSARSPVVIPPGHRYVLPAGFAIDLSSQCLIPDCACNNFLNVGLIRDRSGLSSKSGLLVFGGVIDSNYRGEVFVGLYNTSAHARQIQIGDRIAQLLIQKVWAPELNTVDALSPSERESRGFGSSGI